jgi:Galactose oxidase, central domain/Kelch motif
MKKVGTVGRILLAVVVLVVFVGNVDAQAWRPTGNLVAGRAGHTAVLLQNGKVLVAGGANAQGFLSSAEMYDPFTGTWAATGSMAIPRLYHAMTLLHDGRVLVTGGLTDEAAGSSEVYDPISGTWTLINSMVGSRYSHTATTLQNGKVLIVGGLTNNTSGTTTTDSVKIYDPTTGLFSLTQPLNGTTSGHTATLLPDGRVLVTGGRGFGPFETGQLSSAQIYDPASGLWTIVGSMAVRREGHMATLLMNGQVFNWLQVLAISPSS